MAGTGGGYRPPNRPFYQASPPPTRGPSLGMHLGGPSGRQIVEQRLVMTPRVRESIDEEAVLARAVLPPKMAKKA